MRLGTIPETIIERLLLATGIGPTPLLDTMVALLLARSIMAGTTLGLFEALADGPLTVTEIAERCATDLQATDKLLFALAGSRYLRLNNEKYELAPLARKWLLGRSKHSIRDATIHRYLDLRLMGHAEEFVRTGTPVNFHQSLSNEEWDVYQKGQRSHALYSAPEVARRIPMPAGSRTMLDIGGAHGYYSVALCRRYAGLCSTVLDLPEAVAHSAPILASENMGDRVLHRAGNALSDDLGEEAYDLIFVANLAHHFDHSTNREMTGRIARALRPGGISVFLDIIRPRSLKEAGQVGALTGLYFAITSASGTWTFEEMASWQRAAGLVAQKPIKLLMTPGYGMQVAKKRV